MGPLHGAAQLRHQLQVAMYVGRRDGDEEFSCPDRVVSLGLTGELARSLLHWGGLKVYWGYFFFLAGQRSGAKISGENQHFSSKCAHLG